MKILILTKTLLSEPPRIRHQTCYMLAENNNQVYFCEKPINIIQFNLFKREIDFHKKNVFNFSNIELINHNLRIHPILHFLNSLFTSYFLKYQLKENLLNPDLIINFNYDYYWLKEAFPEIPIFTIINDDFEMMSRFPFFKYITWALKRTCRMSDKVFSVSPVINERLSLWCQPELFLPWSQNNYKEPLNIENKNVILYWGYINDRIDFEKILDDFEGIVSLGFKLRFIGPIEPKVSKILSELANHPLFELRSSCDFKDLEIDDCFAAIMPYKSNELLDKCFIPNKAFQLLSLGLPLIANNSKNLLHKKFIISYSSSKFPKISDAAYEAKKIFSIVQKEIKFFVNNNLAKHRINQLINKADFIK